MMTPHTHLRLAYKALNHIEEAVNLLGALYRDIDCEESDTLGDHTRNSIRLLEQRQASEAKTLKVIISAFDAYKESPNIFEFLSRRRET